MAGIEKLLKSYQLLKELNQYISQEVLFPKKESRTY